MKAEIAKESKVSVITGFTSNYAVHVHERVGMKWKGLPRRGKNPDGTKKKGKYWDPQGVAKPKFLEQPNNELMNDGSYATIFETTYKKTGSIEKSLKACALRLQRDAQKSVPVDTGNLKASAFTRTED